MGSSDWRLYIFNPPTADQVNVEFVKSLDPEGDAMEELQEMQREFGNIHPWGMRVKIEVLQEGKEAIPSVVQVLGQPMRLQIEQTDFSAGMILEVGGPSSWDDEEKFDNMSLKIGDIVYFPKDAEYTVGNVVLLNIQMIVAYEREGS